MQQVIACLDESTWSTSVQDAAFWAADRLQGQLVLFHSIAREPLPVNSDLSGAIGLGARSKLMAEISRLDQQRAQVALQLGKKLLDSAYAKAQEAGLADIHRVQRHGDFVGSVQEHVQEHPNSLLVVGHAGAEAEQRGALLGGHIESLLRRASVPVLLAPREFVAPERFLLAFDGRATTEKAVQQILDTGLLTGMECHIVAIRNKQPDLQERLERASETLAQHGFAVTSSLLEGDIAGQLLEYQKMHGIGLLVMGAFAGSRLRQLFIGSNTLKVLTGSAVPVLVYR